MKMRIGVFLAALVSGLVVSSAAMGQQKQPVEPTETGETGLITLPTAQTLDPGKIAVGAYYRSNVENNKVFEQSIGHLRDTSLTYGEFVVGVGIIEGLELSAQVPYMSFRSEAVTTESNKERDVSQRLGDVRVTPKFRLFQEGDSTMPFSLAFLGSVAIPTGGRALPVQLDRNTAFNNDQVAWEVMGVLDKNLFVLPGDVPVVLTLNIGGLFPNEPDVFRLDRQIEPVFAQLRRKGFPNPTFHDAVVEYGGGLKVPLWVNHIGTLDALAEYRGNTGTIEQIDPYQSILGGLRYTLVNGWAASGGADIGLSNSVERYNVVAGITYTGPQPPPAFAGPAKEKIVYRDRVIQVEKIGFGDINFEFDKATLTDVGRGRVYLIAQKLKEGKNVKVEVQGHTDYIGTEDYNKRLGMKRAETVKSELGRLGVDASRMSTVSFGEDKPLIDMQTPWARAVNRRVEFVVTSESTTTSEAAPAGGKAAPAPKSAPAPKAAPLPEE